MTVPRLKTITISLSEGLEDRLLAAATASGISPYEAGRLALERWVSSANVEPGTVRLTVDARDSVVSRFDRALKETGLRYDAGAEAAIDTWAKNVLGVRGIGEPCTE